MLPCQDCEKYLDAFLDNALDVKQSLDVQEHLHSCTPCTNRAAAERTLRAFIRQHATTPPLPEELKRRIVRQAMQPPQSRGFPWALSPICVILSWGLLPRQFYYSCLTLYSPPPVGTI
jgi:anti-sigma factor (TIGR02949 family)